jgi:polyhydroxybutyrate depolymerase
MIGGWPRSVFALLICMTALACSRSGTEPSPANPALPQGDSTQSITFGGGLRSYLVHVPANYTGNVNVQLVIDLHGFGSNSQLHSASGFKPLSDQRGFIVAWPQGTANSWNGYGCCGEARNNNVDDVGFLRAVVADIRSRVRIDAAMIHVTGHSNGGVMTHRLACEASDLFAAAAPVSFPLNRAGCPSPPSRIIPVIHLHGVQDAVVPYNGSPSSSIGPIQSASDSFAAWRSMSGCSGQLSTQTFADGDRCDTASSCTSGAQPTLCTITGGHGLYNEQTTLNVAEYIMNAFSRP